MQFDDLDKKIREAAERYHPVYDEQAWKLMENLLDKKMPQKQSKSRKTVLPVLLVLFFAGIAYVLYQLKHVPSTGNDILANERPVIQNKSNQTNGQPKVKREEAKILPPAEAEKYTVNIPAGNEPMEQYKREEPTFANGSRFLKGENGETETADIEMNTNVSPGNLTIYAAGDKKILSDTSVLKQDVALKRNTPDTADKAIKTVESKNDAITLSNKFSKQKHSFLNSFSVSLSAGTDVSGVSANKMGRTNVLYGLGIGFSAGARWDIRTGLYQLKKIYKANREDYHPKGIFWSSYPNLDEVIADCKMYEIPLIVDYTFSRNRTHNFNASIGLSSYFMKKETYNYSSEFPAGQYKYDTLTIINGSSHFLSSLRFAAAYEKKISGRVSVSAEPYLTVPLGGIGFGKVKLNSAGILINVSVGLFKK